MFLEDIFELNFVHIEENLKGYMFKFMRTGREKTDWILLLHKMTFDLALLRTPICPQLCGIQSKMSDVSSFLPLEYSSAQLWLRTMTPLEAG